jgi:hypothetical protein
MMIIIITTIMIIIIINIIIIIIQHQHSFIQSFMYSINNSFIYSFIQSFIDSFIHSCIYLHPYNILTYPTYNWLITMAMGLLQGSVQRCRIPCKICCPVPSQSWTFQVEKMEEMRKVVITKLILQGWTIGVPAGWVLAGFSDQCDGYGIL